MANFLQTLLAGASGLAAPVERRPGLTPEWIAEVIGNPGQTPPIAPPPERIASMTQEESPSGPVNLLEGLGYEQPQAGGTNAAAPEPSQPARAPRERRSVLDTVGRVADVLAKVGGAEAMYQPTLDAREDRGFALEDRSRAVDLDKLKLSVAQQGVKDADTEKLGAAVRGLQAIAQGGGDVNKAWPLLAQQMGVDPERAAKIGEELATNPNSVFALGTAINGTPQQQSQAKEVQIYSMLLKNDPEAAKTYLQSLSNPDAITPYQAAQLGIAQQRLGIAGRAEDRQQRTAEQKQGEGTGGASLTPTQRGAVAQTRESIPGIRQTLNRVDQLSKELSSGGSMARGYIGGMVPGQLAGGKAAEFDKAAGLLAAQIRTLIRTAGEGSMSDFESRLALMPVPSRSDSDEGRVEAINNFRSLLSEVEARSTRLLGGGGGSRPARPAGGGQPARTAPQRRNMPAKAPAKPAAPSSGWGKATVVK